MTWPTLPAGAGSPGQSWTAHPEAYQDGPPFAEPLDSGVAKHATSVRELEEDAGGALCEYVRAQARLEPSVRLRIIGDNSTAFDFSIDLAPVLAQGGANVRLFSRSHWTVYSSRLLQTVTTVRACLHSSAEAVWGLKAYILPEWERAAPPSRARRHSNLHPPWAASATGPVISPNEEQEPLVKLGQLRRWCDAYARDPGYLKSFTLKKEVWGWDLDLLRRTIQHRIWASGSRAFVDVEIEVDAHQDVMVQPDNKLTRLRSNTLVVVLAWITLTYPLVWLLLHLFDRHGGTYDQAVASYALKLYPPLPGTFPTETVAEAMGRYPATAARCHLRQDARLVKGPQGVHMLVGQEEADWLRHWEDRILQAVRLHIKGPLKAEALREVEEVQEMSEVA